MRSALAVKKTRPLSSVGGMALCEMKTAMTTRDDPPPGVIESLGGRRVRVHPRHPQWEGDPKSFDECYNLVGEVVVPLIGPTPEGVKIGAANPRVCRFCGQDDTSTTFKKDAHTVGAAFGNRHHLTNEECDLCNEGNSNLDDALARFLVAERITVGVRKRRGFPKVKGKDGTYMEFDGVRQGVTVVVDSTRPNDSEVRFRILSPNSLEVTAPRSAFSYDEVVRNIVRMTWMLLPKEHLGASPEYLQMVLGHTRPEKWEFFRMFAPGAARIVRFRVWRARNEGADIPTTVAAFTIGYMTMVWASCDGAQPRHRPGPLPAFDADARFGDPSIQWMSIAPDATEEAGAQTLRFRCKGLREGPVEENPIVPPIAADQVKGRPRWDVEFRWKSTEGEKRLKSRVHVQRPDMSRPRLLFFDGEFAATLLLDSGDGKSATCQLDFPLAGATTVNALRTLDLLEAMQDTSRGATAQAENGTIWQIGGLEPPPGLDLEIVRARLAELHEVSSSCGVELRVPRDDDALSWATADIISAAIRNQGVVVQHQRRTINLLFPRGDSALSHVELNARGPLSIPSWGRLAIGGVDLEVGNAWLEMADAQLVARTPVERDGAEMESFEFVGDTYSYRFERWLVADS